jgi:DNA-binding transcriptional LysR family regulator
MYIRTMSSVVSDMIFFATVVRAGSFTAAARLLDVSKQTVSERVAKLEEHLGVRLLERTTRTMRVAEHAATYAAQCLAIAAQVDEANRDIQQRQIEPTGLLRVSAPVLYGRRFLAPVVEAVLRSYPYMRVEILLADRRVDLIDEGIDVAIRIGTLDDSSLSSRKLGDAHTYFVASPAFVKAHGRPTKLTLAATRCVGMRASETWAVLGGRFKMQPILVVNDFEMLCDAAVRGIGIARLPAIVCRDAVRQRSLVRVLAPEPTTIPVNVLYPSRQLPPKVRVFVEALSAMVEPMQPLRSTT